MEIKHDLTIYGMIHGNTYIYTLYIYIIYIYTLYIYISVWYIKYKGNYHNMIQNWDVIYDSFRLVYN